MKNRLAEDFSHIYYKNCPHFTVGTANQWGESGFLFFEGRIYSYMEDRECQYNKTDSPRSIADFLEYAESNQIEIPAFFLAIMRDENY